MAKFKLVLSFLDEHDKVINFTYNNAMTADEVQADDVKACMTAFIENGAIFKKVPVTKKAAYIVRTDNTNYAIE